MKKNVAVASSWIVIPYSVCQLLVAKVHTQSEKGERCPDSVNQWFAKSA